MIAELAREEIGAALDGLVVGLLSEEGIVEPPVDTVDLARRLGMTVAADDRQPGRGRLVRFGDGRAARHAAIVVRPEPRRERLHWTVAHEIGETQVERLFQSLSIDPREIDANAREQFANHIAGRLLLPTSWFETIAKQSDWDLLALKAAFETASHELVARRMLDFSPPVVITIYDHGRQTLRLGNLPGGSPAVMPIERECWRAAHETGEIGGGESEVCSVRAWPIHEAGWKREILRSAFCEID